MMQNTITTEPAWYKQFWPWFLIFLPASVVVASMFTIMLATDNADSLVVDDYYKKALQINRDLTKIEHAKKIGLSGSVVIHNDSLQLNLQVQKEKLKLAPVLSLNFVHPTRAEKDFSVVLTASEQARVGNGNDAVSHVLYVSSNDINMIKKIINGAWYVHLLPADKAWQLNGKIKNKSTAISLYAD